MKKNFLLLITLALCSCTRSADQVWEDTKTAGHYLQKGLKSLWGSKDLTEKYAKNEDFFPNFDEEFIPLEDATINTSLEPPQSNVEPGQNESPVPGIERFIKPTGSLGSVFKNIQFELNDFSLKGKEVHKTLDAIADHLKKHKNMYIFIEGHCCERGSAQYNLALGSKRSAKVRTELIKRGVDLNRIFTISYGLERPMNLAQNEEAYRQNRRAEFKLFEK